MGHEGGGYDLLEYGYMNVGGTWVARWWNDVARIRITKNGPYLEMVMSAFDALSAD